MEELQRIRDSVKNSSRLVFFSQTEARGMADNAAKLLELVDTLEARVEVSETKLNKINQWCDAYPLEVFPEPDLKKANSTLSLIGMSTDSIAASMARHVLTKLKQDTKI
jgi:hypothetical protein